MTTLIIILVVVASILLVLVVLAQSPKGSGLSSQFGASGATQLMGTKRTVDVLEKMTWGTVVVIFLLCFVANITLPDVKQNNGGLESPNMEAASEKSTATGGQQNLGGQGTATSGAATSAAPTSEAGSAATSSGQ